MDSTLSLRISIIPAMISFILAIASMSALAFYYFENQSAELNIIRAETWERMVSIEIQVATNSKRIEEIEENIRDLSSQLRGAQRITDAGDDILQTLQALADQIRSLQVEKQ